MGDLREESRPEQERGKMSTNAGQNYPRSHITHKGVKASEPAAQARDPEQKVRHFFGCTREEVR